MPGVAMSSSRPTKGEQKLAPALAASSAWGAEKTSVMLIRMPAPLRIFVAFRPSTVHGHFTTMFLWTPAQCRPSRTIPSASVATTSAEMGPFTVSQIWTRISSGSPLSLESRVGLVVTPSMTPSAAASRISFKLAVSRKIFMSASPGIISPRRTGITRSGPGGLYGRRGRALVAVPVHRRHRVGQRGPAGRGRIAVGGVGSDNLPHPDGRRAGRGAVDAVGGEIGLQRRAPGHLDAVVVDEGRHPGGSGGRKDVLVLDACFARARALHDRFRRGHRAHDVAPALARSDGRVAEGRGGHRYRHQGPAVRALRLPAVDPETALRLGGGCG